MKSTRRKVIIGLGAGALWASARAFSQQSKKISRVGFLYLGSRKSAMESGRYDLLLRSLRELGYVEGSNYALEARYADGKPEALAAMVAELVSAKVDLIIATGTPVYRALQKATKTIPVVMTAGGDPVADGFAASLSKPGGNFTGVTNLATDVTPKVLEYLVTVVPRVSRVAVLTNPANPAHTAGLTKSQAAGRSIGVEVVGIDISTREGIASAFTKMGSAKVQAFMLLGDNFLVQHSREIAGLAIKHRLPSIYSPEYPTEGGLLGYGNDPIDSFRRAAPYVDKILKGANPADLPIDQPTKLEFVINLKTAKAIGLAIPQAVLIRADRVIQ